jgi:hypothetical protein
MALALEVEPEEPPQLRLVLDDEDAGGSVHGSHRTRAPVRRL